MIPFTLKAERAKLQQLSEIAALNHRTRAQEVRWLIDRHIENAAAAVRGDESVAA